MTSAPPPPPSLGARLARVATIVLVFAAIGPAIGGFALIVMIAASQMGLGTSIGDLATIAVFGLIYGVAIAYLVGVVPAAAVGLIVGIWQVFVGRMIWPVALAVGVLAGVIFMVYIERGRTAGSGADTPSLYGILVLTCVLPTMLCWAIVRTWYLEPPASSAPPGSPNP
jgi:hypothetical protein